MIVDTGSAWVFRNEPSGDPARMRSFHMREFVRIGDPADVATFRDAWLERTLGLFGRLGLDRGVRDRLGPVLRPRRPDAGGEPARAGAEVRARRAWSAARSRRRSPRSTTTRTISPQVYEIGLEGGGIAHTGCVAFGIERVTLALFRAHGLDPQAWPPEVRAELWP